ncbi:unnamed protein product [Soboliphyme baturini]|uniref:Uncharacterized protein n=1 Tax=Soboliphyme baturini TaxID=241478 RepID=A0A183IIV0_9BILA|nr:unnamed protein product [Soboliphyme baturini]
MLKYQVTTLGRSQRRRSHPPAESLFDGQRKEDSTDSHWGVFSTVTLRRTGRSTSVSSLSSASTSSDSFIEWRTIYMTVDEVACFTVGFLLPTTPREAHFCPHLCPRLLASGRSSSKAPRIPTTATSTTQGEVRSFDGPLCFRPSHPASVVPNPSSAAWTGRIAFRAVIGELSLFVPIN